MRLYFRSMFHPQTSLTNFGQCVASRHIDRMHSTNHWPNALTFDESFVECIRPICFSGQCVSYENFNVAEVNQQRCFGENGQCLELFYQTHLVLASGKLVLQKRLHSLSLNLFGTVQIVGLFVRGKKSTS